MKKILLLLLFAVVGISLTACDKTPAETQGLELPETPMVEPVVNAIEKQFDKANPGDVTVEISSVSKVYLNGLQVDSSNLIIDSNSVTFKKEFLATLNDDYYNFKVQSSNEQYIRIYVSGSATNPYDEIAFYSNKDYRDYGGNIATITEQWIKYGIGDPYIMRFNGVYYLYVPTKDSEMGLKAWKSLNLVDWVPCQGEGLESSFVSMDPITNHAYPIGMFYYDGTFYMATSPYGKGHYILTSKSPEGPFVAFDNTNHKLDIDGRFFVDDDEQVYFVSTADAWYKGIRMTKVSVFDDHLKFSDEKYLSNSIIHPWTEGPDLFKRDGKYYLTFTGSCVISEGYRISYAVANSYEDFLANNFVEPDNQPLILACDNKDGFEGLGHNGVVLGPDMDSYYVTYHNLNSASGPNRSFNIDRLFFNGSEMTSVYKNKNSVAPKLPRYYTYSGEQNFVEDGEFKLSTLESLTSYTAEFNLTGKDTKTVISYLDAKNYSYVNIVDNKINLYKVTNGTEKLISQGTLNKSYDLDKNLYSIRIQSNGKKVAVYFNNLLKIESEVDLGSGKIGYYSDSKYEIGYTAFSDVSFGESDQIEIKQAGYLITANNYLPNDYYEGVNGHLLTEDSGLKEINNKHFNQAYELVLKNTFDYASYPVNFDETAHYGLEITLHKKYLGKQIAVSIGNEIHIINVKNLTVTDETEDYVTLLVDSFDIEKGINTVKISNFDTSEFGLVHFQFLKIHNESVEIKDELKNVPFIGQAPQVYYLDYNQYTDFTMSVDMMFTSMPEGQNSAGILFRSNNLSMFQHQSHDDEDYTSVQGYYVSFGERAKLERLNYWTTETLVEEDYKNPRGEYFNLKIHVVDNKVEVYIDNELLFIYEDSLGYTRGKVGLYINAANVEYKNLEFKSN